MVCVFGVFVLLGVLGVGIGCVIAVLRLGVLLLACLAWPACGIAVQSSERK